MLNFLLAIIKVDITQRINVFIDFFKDVPLVNKFINERLYKQSKAKLYLGFIVIIFLLMGEIIKKGFFLYLFIYLPSYYLNNNNIINTFLHIFIGLSFITAFLIHSEVFSPNRKKYLAIKVMRIEPKKYMLADLLFKNLLAIITLLPGLIIIFKNFNLAVSYAIILVLYFFVNKLFREIYFIKIYRKLKKNILKKPLYILPGLLLGLTFTFLLPYYHLIPSYSFLFNFWFIVLNIFLLFIGLEVLLKDDNYQKISNYILKRNNILFNVEEIKTSINFGEVKIKSSDLKESKKTTIDNKKGYEYLNGLFYERHKRIIVRPIQKVLGIIGAFFGIILILSLVTNYDQRINLILREILGYCFLILCFISGGERASKAYFYNLDSSLLRYAYYRERQAIIDNFKIRLKLLVKLNIIPAIVMASSFIFLFIINGADIKIYNYFLIFSLMITLAVFFSVNSLSLYYLLQPYTKDFTVSSPLYSVTKIIVYLMGYFFIQFNMLSIKLCLGLLLIIILYIILILYLTFKLAPKTFKLK